MFKYHISENKKMQNLNAKVKQKNIEKINFNKNSKIIAAKTA